MGFREFSGAALALLLLAGCNGSDAETRPGWVDEARMLAANSDADNWLGYGRTYEEQRFSPLDLIDTASIGDLGLAFAVELDTARGQEATPIVVDGIMYISTAWSKVWAVNAVTGEVLWRFDPEVDGAKAADGCCDVVNRGVAVWEGKVFVGTIDGRLIALDAADGTKLWDEVTVDQAKPYTITMAPRVVRGKVLIGNSGAELGVRGYLSAYDADSGEMVWRFYTVPGNPADGPDGAASDEAFAQFAGETWFGNWWDEGGGGTVWDSVVYDADFDQILVGVGNGSPWNHRVRSDGKGDNLFLSSILALDPDTGAYKWHYQLNPGDTWDFTATQQITLVELEIDGEMRKVAMQAPKNGFFYLIDRSDGSLISAEPFVEQNWAEGIDLESGRPIEVEGARYEDAPFFIYPSPLGGHGWMPMSYSPQTGLVYIPAMHVPMNLADNADYDRRSTRWNLAVDMIAAPPGREEEARNRGWLIAWDPVAQQEVWRVEHDGPWNGGTLATAGGLVFQGDARGWLRAHDASTGEELWRFQTGRGVVAAPISYRVDGVQYVALIAGYGGAMALGSEVEWMPDPMPNGMLLAFRLNGDGTIEAVGSDKRPFVSSDETFTLAQIAEGGLKYGQFCGGCHGGPVLPDLWRSPVAPNAASWNAIVHDGALTDNGMIGFADWLSEEQVEAIRAYVLSEAARRAEAEDAG